MHHDKVLKSSENTHGTLSSYVTGFALSVVFTLVAYVLVVQHILEGKALMAAIVGLAIVQLLVQLFFFLHLHKESKPRWNLVVFLFMLLILLIVVIGSLWIMHNLDYNMMMQPEQMDSYMREQADKGF